LGLREEPHRFLRQGEASVDERGGQ